MVADQRERTKESRPDTRGPTAPIPATIFGAGIASLVISMVGTVVVQIAYAMSDTGLTQDCIDSGLKESVTGAVGVCHIVEGLRSNAETLVLGSSIVIGLAAAAAGFMLYRRMDTRRRREQAIAGAVVGVQAVVFSAFVLVFRSGELLVTFVRNFLNFAVLEGHLGAFVRGAKNTLLLALGGEVGGVIIGLILAMMVLSARRTVRAPARVYINFFRGTPLIFQLSFIYLVILLGFNFKMSSFKAAILIFSLNTGAYAAEVFRAGIQSIERGQVEAARGLGMSYLQAMRYVVVPQGIRRVIPPLLNEFVILIKDTALVIVLGLTATQFELFTTAQNGYSDTFNGTFFVAAALGYLAVTLPMVGIVNAVERRLRSGLLGVSAGQE